MYYNKFIVPYFRIWVNKSCVCDNCRTDRKFWQRSVSNVYERLLNVFSTIKFLTFLFSSERLWQNGLR